MSLPRDSYVPIPGHGRNKLNAAYAFGGAPLLVRTVETVTGIRIDHYAEIGFGGFVGHDRRRRRRQALPRRATSTTSKAGLHVKKGCQDDGRRDGAGLCPGALLRPEGRPGPGAAPAGSSWARCSRRRSARRTLLNPFRVVPLGNAGTTALTVDERDGPIDLLRFALAMRAVAGGKGIQTTVPIADA